MKPPAEMNEGPEALKRFENTMKALFSKRKANTSFEKQARAKPEKKTAKEPKLHSLKS